MQTGLGSLKTRFVLKSHPFFNRSPPEILPMFIV